MKYKNKIFILPILFIFIILMVSAANTVTLNLPAANQSVSGSYVLSASLDTNSFNLTNGTFFYDTGTANVTIGITANDSATQFNFTWATTGIVDVDNYVIWVNITNNTNREFTGGFDASTGVDIENGAPTTTLASNHFSDLTNVRNDSTFTVAADADSTRGVSSCVVYFVSTRTAITDNASTIAPSSNACSTTYTVSTIGGLQGGESYNVFLEYADGNSNKTNSSSRVLVFRDTQGAIVQGGGVESPRENVLATVRNIGTNISNSVRNFVSSIKNFFSNLFNR
ncbi:MAG: hypothetical protein AABY22_13735 [Nanoarchaeota archaeon]